ncbi:hypothetical protein D3C79_755410 [compost metagenome]
MELGHRDPLHHRQHRDVGGLVILEAEDGNRIGVRHLPQAEDRQQDKRPRVELAAHRAVADDGWRGAGEAADQGAIDRMTLHVEAVDPHIDQEAQHRQQGGQRIGREVEQCNARNAQGRRIPERHTGGDEPPHQGAVLGALHDAVDVPVDVVVEHTTGGDHQ